MAAVVETGMHGLSGALSAVPPSNRCARPFDSVRESGQTPSAGVDCDSLM